MGSDRIIDKMNWAEENTKSMSLSRFLKMNISFGSIPIESNKINRVLEIKSIASDC